MYVLDSDSFIRSKREHYALDICPGYWDFILRAFHQKQLISIAPVGTELRRGNDALATWVKSNPVELFQPIETPDIQAAYRKVVTWVEENEQYSRSAKQKFFNGADPWLVAFATVNKQKLVTYEVRSPESKTLVKLPDVANQFAISCIPPYVMLRDLKARLLLSENE